MLGLKLMNAYEFYAAQLEGSLLSGPVTAGTPVIAQQFDQDLIGDTGTLLKGFYESGQLWALLIGLALGYMFKSFTSYG